MELVERTEAISAPDGPMRVFSVRPAEASDLPVVILIHDILGLHCEIKDFVRKVAREGFYCLAPDLYYRTPIEVFRGRPDQETTKVLVGNIATADLVADVGALLAHCSTLPAARADARKGCIGICRGGGQAIAAAGAFADQIVGTVCFYPTRLMQDTPDTEYYKWASDVRGELHLVCPEHDDLLPTKDLRRFSDILTDQPVDYSMQTLGGHHGWNFPSREEYNKELDLLSWRVAFDCWNRVLN